MATTYKITPKGDNAPASFTIQGETYEAAATAAAQKMAKTRAIVALRVTGDHGKSGHFQGYVKIQNGQNSSGRQFHVMETTPKPSGKLIREWSDSIKVGIWDNCDTSIRLYADRAIYKAPYVKWRDNSGSLDFSSRRIVGSNLAALLKIAREEDEDGEDYTSQAFEILSYDY